jgi:hypothetical protein
VRVDELRRRVAAGTKDRAAHEQLHARLAGRVDSVAVPGHRVVMRAGEQEHLLHACHRRGERGRIGQVAERRVDARPEPAALGLAADQRPNVLAGVRQRLDQGRADLAVPADHQDHRSALPDDGPDARAILAAAIGRQPHHGSFAGRSAIAASAQGRGRCPVTAKARRG